MTAPAPPQGPRYDPPYGPGEEECYYRYVCGYAAGHAHGEGEVEWDPQMHGYIHGFLDGQEAQADIGAAP